MVETSLFKSSIHISVNLLLSSEAELCLHFDTPLTAAHEASLSTPTPRACSNSCQ